MTEVRRRRDLLENTKMQAGTKRTGRKERGGGVVGEARGGERDVRWESTRDLFCISLPQR